MSANPIAPNAMRLLWAGFTAILASGVGMAIRTGIFDNWKSEFHFTNLQVGLINGAGLSGFCFGIMIGGFLADRIGYGKLVMTAFSLHFLSAIVTFIPTGAGAEGTLSSAQQTMAFAWLWLAAFLFAGANGTLEAVANPLVATLFPANRTHYLN
ncbi:MAG TPA: hypothetical protein VNC50_01810, partial [Planctomycetia bacterium]|nr:hypothetical protein [Planctomycetia bacterium]